MLCKVSYSPLSKQVRNRFAFSVLGNVDGTFFDVEGVGGRDAQSAVNGCVQVLHGYRILDSRARTFFGRFAIHHAAFDAAAKQDYGSGGGEMPMHAVVLGFAHDVWRGGLIFDFFADLTFSDGVAAKLTGENHQRSI